MTNYLAGKRVLVTRSESQSTVFMEKLEELGAIPLVAPLLTFHPKISNEIKELFTELHDFTWVFFTSANGVKFFLNQLDYWDIDHSVLKNVKIAVVGKKTNDMLAHFNFSADFQPDSFHGRQMVREFLQFHSINQRIMLICGNRSRDDISTELTKNRVFFRKVVIYDTLLNEESKPILLNYIENEIPDIYTFMSPSTIDAFIEFSKPSTDKVKNIKQSRLCVCIGTTTEKKAIQEGFKNILVPDVFTIEGMINELNKFYKRKG
ncbi:uroporphyrinogen-III synthase [Aquibacillus saliphilus]|uniref:uroporphyrinogen-III synthase n=1 Tax=Aquibacillus saliphilus TaxID=1909422 RepID=UPI001CEFFE37|nr:uroporphyrinogen-III synthase [Aquibacillus saliphilus]